MLLLRFASIGTGWRWGCSFSWCFIYGVKIEAALPGLCIVLGVNGMADLTKVL